MNGNCFLHHQLQTVDRESQGQEPIAAATEFLTRLADYFLQMFTQGRNKNLGVPKRGEFWERSMSFLAEPLWEWGRISLEEMEERFRETE